MSDDFLDAYNAEKNVGNSAGEPARTGGQRVETDKKSLLIPLRSPLLIQVFATKYAVIQGVKKKPQLAEAGLEPALTYGKGILNP